MLVYAYYRNNYDMVYNNFVTISISTNIFNVIKVIFLTKFRPQYFLMLSSSTSQENSTRRGLFSGQLKRKLYWKSSELLVRVRHLRIFRNFQMEWEKLKNSKVSF